MFMLPCAYSQRKIETVNYVASTMVNRRKYIFAGYMSGSR